MNTHGGREGVIAEGGSCRAFPGVPVAGAAVIPGGMVRSTSWTRARGGPFVHDARGGVPRGADTKVLRGNVTAVVKVLRGNVTAVVTSWVLAALLLELRLFREGRPHVAPVLRGMAGIFVVLIDGNSIWMEGVAGVVAIAATTAAVSPLLLLVLAFVDCFGNARAAAFVVTNHGCFGDVRNELDVRVSVRAEDIQIKIRTKRRTRWKWESRGPKFSLFPLEFGVS